MGLRYSVVIPAYNEEAAIGRAIRETAAVFDPLKEEYEIIVVDDASEDATAEIVSALCEEVPALGLLRHEQNRGKGTAVRTGVMNANGETVFFLDADLATHPSEAEKFIARIGEADIIIGSRRAKGAVIAAPQPWHRSVLGRMINFFVRRFLKLSHRDTQCGFKMFKAEAARAIFKDLSAARWTFDIEVLMRADAMGYKVLELPVTWRDGKMSRVRVREVLGDLKYLWRLKNKLDD